MRRRPLGPTVGRNVGEARCHVALLYVETAPLVTSAQHASVATNTERRGTMARRKTLPSVVGATTFNAAATFGGVAFNQDDTVIAAVAVGDQESKLLMFNAANGVLAGDVDLGANDHFIVRSSHGWVTWVDSIRSTSDDGKLQWKRKTKERIAAVACGGDVLSFLEGNTCVVVRAKSGRGGCKFEVPNRLISLAVSPDGTQIAIGTSKGIQLHNAKNGEQIGSRKTTAPLTLAFSPGGDRLASGHGNGKIQQWSTETLKAVKGFGRAQHTFDGAGGPAGCRWLRYGEGGNTILSLGNEHGLREWDAATGEELRRLDVPKHHAQGSQCALATNFGSIATGSTSGPLTVWQLASGERSSVDAVLPEPHLLSANKTDVVVANRISVQRYTAGEAPTHRPLEHDAPTFEMAISAEDRASFALHGGTLESPSVSADGALIAMPIDASIKVWTSADKALQATLPCDGNARACCFGPDGAWIVALDRTGAHVHSTSHGYARLQSFPLEWGELHVHGISLSPKGRLLALSVDKDENNFYPESAVLIVDLSTGVVTTLEPDERLRFGGVVSDGGNGFFVADSLGRLHHINARAEAVFDEVLDPLPAVVAPRLHPAWPVCVTPNRRCGHLALDGNIHFHPMGRRAKEVGTTPKFDAAPPQPEPEPAGMFDERMAGRTVLYAGRFEHTSKAFREQVARELGAKLTKTANAKVTHLVFCKPTYGAHKPTAAEKTIKKLIDGGANIEMLNEVEWTASLLPTPSESLAMLSGQMTGGLARWNRWMERYRERVLSEMFPLGAMELSGAKLKNAYLQFTDLAGANLQGADLQGAQLERANLRGANLRDTNLTNANVYQADLRQADLRGATICDGFYAPLHDKTTRWPTGFTPTS